MASPGRVHLERRPWGTPTFGGEAGRCWGRGTVRQWPRHVRMGTPPGLVAWPSGRARGWQVTLPSGNTTLQSLLFCSLARGMERPDSYLAHLPYVETEAQRVKNSWALCSELQSQGVSRGQGKGQGLGGGSPPQVVPEART